VVGCLTQTSRVKQDLLRCSSFSGSDSAVDLACDIQRCQQKAIARALQAKMEQDARLIKQVAHLPNSGVTALDIAKANQVLGIIENDPRNGFQRFFNHRIKR
jgi:high-affinity K+ transport system ATPase subunit B